MASNVLKTLGRIAITAGGTPQRLVSVRTPCHAFMIQVDPANTNKVFVMNQSGLMAAPMTGVLCILPVPTTNSIPSYSPGMSTAPNQLDLFDIWIDGTTAEGVIVSYLEG